MLQLREEGARGRASARQSSEEEEEEEEEEGDRVRGRPTRWVFFSISSRARERAARGRDGDGPRSASAPPRAARPRSSRTARPRGRRGTAPRSPSRDVSAVAARSLLTNSMTAGRGQTADRSPRAAANASTGRASDQKVLSPPSTCQRASRARAHSPRASRASVTPRPLSAGAERTEILVARRELARGAIRRNTLSQHRGSKKRRFPALNRHGSTGARLRDATFCHEYAVVSRTPSSTASRPADASPSPSPRAPQHRTRSSLSWPRASR